MTSSFSISSAEPVGKGIYRTEISDLLFIGFEPHDDGRGYYAELNRIPEINDVLLDSFQVQQINLSHSHQNVARGFHAEQWRKLLTVTRGTIFAAIVDIRSDSPTFGKVVTFNLGENPTALKGSLFLPKGVGNSFCVVEGPVDYIYCVDQLYKNRDTSFDRSISLFDPDLSVQWPLPADELIISDRDKQATTLRQLYPDKFAK